MSTLEDLRAQIAEGCESVSYVTSGIFVISIFLTILRPDPTLAICLFGFYGAHVRSKGAIRSFWIFLLMSVLVDGLWVVQYSALRPFAWSQVQQMTRREQVAVAFSFVNMIYKVGVVSTGVQLQLLFGKLETALLEQANLAQSSTSSGAVVDGGSLAAQDSAAASSKV